MHHQGYLSDPPLPEVRAANREFAEKKKEWKDAEKRRRDWKRDKREAREKENRARVKEGKSPIPTPDSTPEPESSPSAEGEVDPSALPGPSAPGPSTHWLRAPGGGRGRGHERAVAGLEAARSAGHGDSQTGITAEARG